MKQSQENAILLRQALAELHELKQQVQSQKKIPFTVKTCGFEVGSTVQLHLNDSQLNSTSFILLSLLKDTGCLPITTTSRKIQLESKWYTTFRVVPVENFREQRNV